MLIFSTVFTVVVLSAQASAQSISRLWLLGHYDGPIEGSIINSDPVAATWTIKCAKIGPGCSLPPNLTITEGSSTLAYSYTLPNDYLFKVACQVLPGISSGDCVLTLQSSDDISVKTTMVGPDVLSLVPVTLTAGPGSSPSTPGPAMTASIPKPPSPPYPTPSTTPSAYGNIAPTYVASTGALPFFANITVSPGSDLAKFPTPTKSSPAIDTKPVTAGAMLQSIPWSLGALAVWATIFLF